VLSNGSDAGPGTSTDELLVYLGLHGVAAEVVLFAPTRSIGRDLLKTCAGLGTDMMVMGAYGDSHERETVFGGNTQTIVDNATMPVLLNH